MKEKVYLHALSECKSGEIEIYTEFIDNIATRQITNFENKLYSSSDLKDWCPDIGYLLYDGLLTDLDLSDTKEISQNLFEQLWFKSISNEDIDNFIHYHAGDASLPIDQSTLIIHIVNNLGKWGKGFVLSLSKNYPIARSSYLDWSKSSSFILGETQFILADSTNDIFVCNMLSQNGIKKSAKDNNQYLDYDALDKCLKSVADYALLNRLKVQGPKIGSGLSGGDWNIIQDLIKKNICYKKIHCHIFEYY